MLPKSFLADREGPPFALVSRYVACHSRPATANPEGAPLGRRAGFEALPDIVLLRNPDSFPSRREKRTLPVGSSSHDPAVLPLTPKLSMKASGSVVCEEAFVKESPTSSGNPFNCRAGRTLEEELQGEGTGENRREPTLTAGV